MMYRIQITAQDEDETLLFHKNFKEHDDLTNFYYDNLDEFQIKYRGCILTSYKMYPLENGDYKLVELQYYYNVFPEIPNTHKNINYDLSDRTVNIKNIFKIVMTVLVLIIIFPVALCISAAMEVK